MKRYAALFPIALLATTGAWAQESAPQWSTTRDGGVAVASWSLPEGPPLLSVACDEETGEIVFFRAVEPPVEAEEMTLVTAMGRMSLVAEADPHGAPGIIARAPADASLTEALTSAATVTFEIPPEGDTAEGAPGGLAVPVGDQFREIIDSCAGPD